MPSSTMRHFAFVEVVSEDSRDGTTGGAVVREEVVAATSGPQNQTEIPLFLFFYWINISRLCPTCMTRQVRFLT